MEINERNRAAIFSEGKEGSGGDFCEEGEVHSGPHNSRDTPGEEAGKLSLIKARSPSPSSSLDRLIRRIFFFFK